MKRRSHCPAIRIGGWHEWYWSAFTYHTLLPTLLGCLDFRRGGADAAPPAGRQLAARQRRASFSPAGRAAGALFCRAAALLLPPAQALSVYGLSMPPSFLHSLSPPPCLRAVE